MEKYLKIQEAAALLSLHPQTIYRKCMRNEIIHIRYGRTIRIPSSEVFPQPESPKNENAVLPSFMVHLFWDCDPQMLRAKHKVVMERVLQNGDIPAWR